MWTPFLCSLILTWKQIESWTLTVLWNIHSHLDSFILSFQAENGCPPHHPSSGCSVDYMIARIPGVKVSISLNHNDTFWSWSKKFDRKVYTLCVKFVYTSLNQKKRYS